MLGLQLMAQLRRLFRERSGGVAVLFGLSALPLAMVVGLAVDFSFYIQVKAQVNLAADAAAMHAVSVASRTYAAGTTTMAGIQAAGQAAGQQWFAAQLGALTNGTVSPGNVTVAVAYNTSPSGFTAAVSYTGTVATHFGGLFHMTTFPISGAANAAIANLQLEVVMMIDNSASMLIGATADDMYALQQATPCSTRTGINSSSPESSYHYEDYAMNDYDWGHNVGRFYSWIYTAPYGYGGNGGNTAPPPTQNGICDPRYTGDPRLCTYIATYPNVKPTNTYQCTNGGGTPLTVNGTTWPHAPNLPCAFACHTDAGGNDNFGLARSLGITLRLDVAMDAAATVISALQSKQAAPGQFSVAMWTFNANGRNLYPTSNGPPGTDLAAALTAVQNAKTSPPVLSYYRQDTEFQNFSNALANYLTPSGNGTTAATAKKSLFIITDGVSDTFCCGNGSMVSSSSGSTDASYCTQFWDKGISVYVLYTPYLPLPSEKYFTTNKMYTEPTSNNAVLNSLKACARTPSNFFQASDTASINTAMTNLVAAALNAPGRVAN